MLRIAVDFISIVLVILIWAYVYAASSREAVEFNGLIMLNKV